MNRPDDEREAAAEQAKAKPFVRSERLGDNNRAVREAALKTTNPAACQMHRTCRQNRLIPKASMTTAEQAAGGPKRSARGRREGRRSTVGEHATRRLLRSGQSPVSGNHKESHAAREPIGRKIWAIPRPRPVQYQSPIVSAPPFCCHRFSAFHPTA